jgi:hypothetical protein
MLRLQDTFEEDGLWWLPATPEHQVPGNFRFDQELGPTISLGGLLRGLPESFNADRDERLLIHGVTRSGKLVTLLQCLNKSRQLQFPGICTEVYRAHIAAVGLHFQGADEELFHRSQFHFDGLEQWLGRRPLQTGRDPAARQISVTAIAPAEELLVELADQRLLAGAIAGTKDTKETQTTIYSQSTLTSVPHEPRSLDWHFHNAVQIESLATLTTGRHLPLTWIQLQGPMEELGPGVTRPTTVDIIASMQHPTSTRRATDEPIIRWQEISNLSPDSVSRWFRMDEDLGSVIGIVLTLIAEDRMFVNVRFLLAIQALEAFHRSVDAKPLMDSMHHARLCEALLKAIPEGTSREMRDKLKGTLQFTNEPSLRQRLRGILSGVAERYGDAPAGFSKTFISSLVDTRNYETHHTPELKKKALDNDGMYWASRRVLALLVVLLIEKLGIPPAEIMKGLQRHQEFLQLWHRGGVL